MLKYRVVIRGIAPLLFNRFPDEDNPEGKSRQKTAHSTRDEQVEKSLYRDEKGKVYQPAEHIIGAMIKAASAFKLEGKKTYRDVVSAGVFIEPMKIVHVKQKYITDWRSVVIKATRGRVMRGRARMDTWELKFDLICIDDRMDDNALKEIIKYAGGYIGVGDYRPRYGRFEVLSLEKVK